MTMPDTTVEAVSATGPAHVPLAKDPRKSFAALLVVAQFALLTSLLTPVVVAMSIKISLIVPTEAAAVQGLVLGIGSVMALIATPLFGNLSDRTRSRLGRRRPWLLGGAVVGTSGLAVVGLAESVAGLVVGYALAQLSLNAATAAVSGIYADRIPEKWQGRVGALLGVAANFGAIAGAGIATAFSTNIALTFVVPGLFAIVAVTVLCLVVKDSAADACDVPPFSMLEILKSYTWPVRDARDFSVNFASRFLIWLGYSALMTYQALLFIQHFGIPPQQVAGYMLTATGISGAATLIGSVSGGWITDRLDRRRGFVIFSGIVIGAGLILIGLAPSVSVVFAAGALAGFGLGIYLAVDLALAVRLIPDARSTGRYMGIVMLASNAPGVLTPLLAPLLLAAGASAASPNFALLFLVAGAVSVLGALAMLGVRSVR